MTNASHETTHAPDGEHLEVRAPVGEGGEEGVAGGGFAGADGERLRKVVVVVAEGPVVDGGGGVLSWVGRMRLAALYRIYPYT